MANYRSGWSTVYKRVDVPSDKLYTCFYCGEVSCTEDHVPPISRYHDYYALYNRHLPLLLPCCSECNNLLGASMQADIYERFDHCKTKLTKKYAKVLRYGEIWDADSAEYAGFTGHLQLFVESAQKLSSDVQQRIDWQHWGVSVDGSYIDMVECKVLKIGNKTFSSLDHLFEHARKVDRIPVKYLEAVLNIVGYSRIEYAYGICKRVPVKTEAQMREVLGDIEYDFQQDVLDAHSKQEEI